MPSTDALARPLLSSIFLWGGYHAMTNPDPLANRAADALGAAGRVLEGTPVPSDPATLVRINGAVQVAAGSLLALGIAPRLSAAVLAGSLIPTTVGGHAFWKETEAGPRAAQQVQVAKNLSILGGLLVVMGRR